MSSEQQEGQISDKDSEFSVDLKTNKIKKKSKKKKNNKNKPPKIITSTYKKQKCTHYNKGNCTKGDTCTFSHDFQPESSKVIFQFYRSQQIICRYFLSNACTKGAQCNFLHSTQQYPCKFFHLENRCNMKQQCRFSHGPVNKEYINDLIKENKDLIINLHKDQKINLIQDKNLKKQVQNFIVKQVPPAVSSSQQQPHASSKKHGFKGQLKLLALNNISEQTAKPKPPMDPRLKIKQTPTALSTQKHPPPPLKQQQPQKRNSHTQTYKRNWITQIPTKQQYQINQPRVIDKRMIQKFLYSYY